MTKYHLGSEAGAKASLERDLKLIQWVQDNLKPGMKCRFQGSRSNRGKNSWREVLDVQINPNVSFMEKTWPNKNYVEFEYDGPRYKWGDPAWREAYEAQKAEFRKIHPDTESYFSVTGEFHRTKVISKNVSLNQPEFASVIVAENDATYLMEVEIDGVWIKAKDLIK